MIRIFLISICLFFSLIGLAQVNTGALDRKFNKALHLYQKGQLKKADGLFKEIIAAAPKSAEIYSKIGRHYYDNSRFQDAAYFFEMGSKSVPSGKQVFALPLAKAYFRAGAHERAANALRSFQSNATTAQSLLDEVQQLQKAIEFSRLVTYNTHNVKVENQLMAVNSEADEYAPSFSHIQQDIIFTRKVNGIDEDFFISSLDTCGFWSVAEDMGFPINSSRPESYQNRAYSDKYMIYQKCDNRSVNGWERGGCDLYLSYATKTGWSEPQPFGYTINTTAFEGMPSLSADEKSLYFVSDRPGGYGGKDIWVSHFVNNRWQVPQNLGPNINTDKDEIAPAIASDGKTIFFSSNGRPGMGGFDIYMSRQQVDSTWTMAANLGSPINSSYEELSGSLTLDGKHIYFSSDRIGGYGGMDIYKAEIPKPFLPKSMSIVYGKVTDFETESVITDCEITADALTLDAEDMVLKSNRGDGSFFMTVPRGSRFIMQIEHPYYQTFKDSLYLTNNDIDTVRYKLFPNDYEASKKEVTLLSYNYLSDTSLVEDSICILLNQKLQDYSGRMLGVEINTYFKTSDSAKLAVFNNKLILCFYKMGISEEYIKFVNWEILEGSVFQSQATETKSGEVSIKIDYLSAAQEGEMK